MDYARRLLDGDERFAALLILADGSHEPGCDQWNGCLAVEGGARCEQPANIGPYCGRHFAWRGDFGAPMPWNRDEVVYFMSDGEHVKIGRSKDATAVRFRLDSVQTGNPRRVSLLRMIPSPRGTEFRLHRLLHDARAVGEWFTLDSKQVQDVLAATDTNVIARAWGDSRHTLRDFARLRLQLVTHEQVCAAADRLAAA